MLVRQLRLKRVSRRAFEVVCIPFLMLGACDRNTPTSPGVHARNQGADSIRLPETLRMSATPPSNVTTIQLKAGDQIKITIDSMECGGDPETVNIYGVIAAQSI